MDEYITKKCVTGEYGDVYQRIYLFSKDEKSYLHYLIDKRNMCLEAINNNSNFSTVGKIYRTNKRMQEMYQQEFKNIDMNGTYAYRMRLFYTTPIIIEFVFNPDGDLMDKPTRSTDLKLINKKLEPKKQHILNCMQRALDSLYKYDILNLDIDELCEKDTFIRKSYEESIRYAKEDIALSV